MKIRSLWLRGMFLFLLLTLSLSVRPALAHESITVGNYEIEVGWLNEPPVATQSNFVVVNVSTTSGEPVEDVSSLVVKVSYGGQEKMLSLRPLDEHSSGQYIAPLLPVIPGQYTIILGGALGDTPINAEVDPEEVEPTDTLAFPNVDSSQPGAASAGFGATEWLALGGFVTGLAGLILSIFSLRRSRT